jgi:signal transduction histidine kinase
MDGFAVCAALRDEEATREVPVIFLSARGDLGDRVTGLDQGAVDYLVKPFVPDDLLARVRAALRTKSLQAELRQAFSELRQVDLNRQELVSMLAHDIRGMLGAVASAVEMARLDLEELPNRDAHRFLDIAERNTTELVDLTTNLLDIYRLDEGRLRPRAQPVELALLANDLTDRLAGQARRKETRLVVAGAVQEQVIADRDLLERVLLNLVTNALKFSPPGGTVTIELGADMHSPAGLPGLVVAVRDEGPGIALEDQPHLFERFTPLALPSGRRPVGSGLGLAFCQKVVGLMGGEIWVDSAPGRGSTFAFVLPIAGGSISVYREVGSEPGQQSERGSSMGAGSAPDRPIVEPISLPNIRSGRAAAIVRARNDRRSVTR